MTTKWCVWFQRNEGSLLISTGATTPDHGVLVQLAFAFIADRLSTSTHNTAKIPILTGPRTRNSPKMQSLTAH